MLFAKRVELELKAIDEKMLKRTIKDLCSETSPENLWLKSTHGKSMYLEM